MPRQKGLDRKMIENMELKYKDYDQDGEGQEYLSDVLEDEVEDENGMLQKALLPSVEDPSLWQVRVKRGCEKQATLQLMNKAIHKARDGQHLSILSVTCTDKVEGFIYVEAFKEIHVKEAIAGLSVILGGKCLLVQKEEMPGIYQNDKQQIQLETHQWVRVKQGLYMNDLGLVEAIQDDKVYLRLIPRLDLSQLQQNGKQNQ